MGADVIAGRSIIADSVQAENIIGSVITGKTIRTSSSGTRIELATNDKVNFYRNGTFVGALEQTLESVGESRSIPDGGGGDTPVIRLAAGAAVQGPRVILAEKDTGILNQGAYMYSDDAGDDYLAQNYMATTKYGGNRYATIFSPQIDLLGDQTYISASGSAESEDPEEQSGILTLAAGTLKIITNDMDPSTIREVDTARYFALGYDNDTSNVVLVNGGGGTGTAGYFNGSSPGTLNNRIFYNNSNSYPGSARAGDILIWFTT
jgi:hypothetical protein